MAAFLAALSQLHLQPGIACSTCSLSNEPPAMRSNTMDDAASKVAARGLDVDQLRVVVSRRALRSACRQQDTGAAIGAGTTCFRSARDVR